MAGSARTPPSLPSPPSLAKPPGLPPPRPRSRAGVGIALLLLSLTVAAALLFSRTTSPALAADRSAARLQTACDTKDSQAATALIHPEIRASYGQILKDHKAELPRLGKLLATRKLLATNANVAEYEVTEDGQTFVVTFERMGDQWLLSGL